MTIEVEIAGTGQIAEFPDGTPPEVIQQALAGQQQAAQEQGNPIVGAADILGNVIASTAKEGIKGISAVGGLINPFSTPSEAVANAEGLEAALPDFQLGEQGQALLKTLTEKFKDSPEVVQGILGAALTLGPSVGESVFQATEGLPAPIRAGAASLAGAIPGALEAATTLRGGRSVVNAATESIPDASDVASGVSNNIKLIGSDGIPTPDFEKALTARGLTIDNVGQELATLPTNVEPKQAVSAIIRRKLLNNDKDDALATLKLSKTGVIQDDLIANEALKQGFQAADIQAAKTMSEGSKVGARAMVKINRSIKADSSLKIRPTDVVGKAVMKRFTHIRDAANSAVLELDRIARTKLKGLNVDTGRIQSDFLSDLNDLDITITRPQGSIKPRLDFEGSLISKDPTSQKVIQNALDLLAETKSPNALRAHKLKKQLDSMLDFNKKSAAGLTDAGKKVAGSLRKSLNNAIRDVSDEYADVNDILSESIGSLDEFQRVLGPSIDVFAEGAEKAIGTDMRGLLSHRKSRIRLENSVNALDETAKNLGGNFDDSISDLVNFAETLDDQFGTPAKTSFKGQVASGAKQAAKGRAGAFEAGVDFVGEKLEKARNINDAQAFRVMEALLKSK